MGYYIVKVLLSSVLIVAVAEIGKRHAMLAALLASVPLVSVLAMIWLYIDTQDTAKVSAFAGSIVWLVLPSLVLFVALPLWLNRGFGFYASLGLALLAMLLSYALALLLWRYLGSS